MKTKRKKVNDPLFGPRKPYTRRRKGPVPERPLREELREMLPKMPVQFTVAEAAGFFPKRTRSHLLQVLLQLREAGVRVLREGHPGRPYLFERPLSNPTEVKEQREAAERALAEEAAKSGPKERAEASEQALLKSLSRSGTFNGDDVGIRLPGRHVSDSIAEGYRMLERWVRTGRVISVGVNQYRVVEGKR